METALVLVVNFYTTSREFVTRAFDLKMYVLSTIRKDGSPCISAIKDDSDKSIAPDVLEVACEVSLLQSSFECGG